MSTVLHPVGPEPARTYWIRRALILGAALIIVVIVLAVVIGSSGSPAAADDPPPGDPSLSAGSSSSAEVSPATITPTAMVSATPGDTASPSPIGTPTSPVTTAAPSPTPTKIVPVACQPSLLRATLTGKQSLKRKAPNTFALSLINGAPIACIVTVRPQNYELKIYSGTDRIWSSKDCATLVKPTTMLLASQQALEWRMTWNGRRSRPGCKQRPEIPKPGTYFATSQYAGAAPVQLRMILHG